MVPCAVLIAVGGNGEGQRSVLGVSVWLGEAEVHGRDFFAGLQGRGLHGVERIVSDDHTGLKAAREARFPGVPWQRCQFHLTRLCEGTFQTRRVPRMGFAGSSTS